MTTQSSIIGGISNYISGQNTTNIFALIGQGFLNRIIPTRGAGYSFPFSIYQPEFATILNGTGNTNKTKFSTILNGKDNYIESRGGNGNMPKTGYTTIVNGVANTAITKHVFIGTGVENYAGIFANQGNQGYNVIVNGVQNKVVRKWGSILNGFKNSATTFYSTVINGEYNLANGIKTFIAQGSGNTAGFNTYATIINGKNNTASGIGSFIGNGSGNTAINTYSSTINGISNKATGIGSFIGNGLSNTTLGQYSAVVNGQENITNAIRSAILNGSGNTVSAGSTNSSIVGGSANIINSNVTNAVILGSTGLSLSNPSSSSTGNDNNHTYVDYLRIRNTPNGGTKFLTIDANGYVYSSTSGGGGGTSGSSGSSGAAGTSGSSGSSGSRGTSGSSGSSGSSGTSGTSGTDKGLIAANSGYINNPNANRYYVGNSIDGGWNAVPWDLQAGINAPATLTDNSDFNCGVPLPRDIGTSYKIKVCGMAYSRGAVGVSRNLTVQLSYLLCSDFAIDARSTKAIADNEATPVGFNSTSGHACFSVSANAPVDLLACETFLYVGFQVDNTLGNTLEFSYTISYEPA